MDFPHHWAFVDANRHLFVGKLAAPASLLRDWSRSEDRCCVEGADWPPQVVVSESGALQLMGYFGSAGPTFAIDGRRR